MKKTTVDNIYCKHCGSMWDEDDHGTCSNCGKEGRKIIKKVEGRVNFVSSLGWLHTKEFYEKDKSALIIVLLIPIVSSFVGYFFGGAQGVIIGLGLSIIGILLGLKAITKVREIKHGR